MTYQRVIPRDLFNEANLLKCYGQVYIALETANAPKAELVHNGAAFKVEQDPNDGSISVANVKLKVSGKSYRLFRPMNSRDAWPLYLTTSEGDEIQVFNANGMFTSEMSYFVRGK